MRVLESVMKEKWIEAPRAKSGTVARRWILASKKSIASECSVAASWQDWSLKYGQNQSKLCPGSSFGKLFGKSRAKARTSPFGTRDDIELGRDWAINTVLTELDETITKTVGSGPVDAGEEDSLLTNNTQPATPPNEEVLENTRPKPKDEDTDNVVKEAEEKEAKVKKSPGWSSIWRKQSFSTAQCQAFCTTLPTLSRTCSPPPLGCYSLSSHTDHLMKCLAGILYTYIGRKIAVKVVTKVAEW
ncbi:hypothetical protein BDK51DRAFT_30714 [Blyttiomyces helicus]|uniref:Uncharacterized protein n=1 Tax=Blyttiomyces helicus TaxID=388810 RepID=A0A4P9W399_9FUNG|nr:hypothetical protein BDK51DRAFT_30714 [Blyttiomyces helicus]|eukprot:RKO84586.1 hypothetical protein BDK51DRAFT_30714 [Blyttiomyces helicus]